MKIYKLLRKIKKRNFTELGRLAIAVRTIEKDCSAVPVGAYKLTATSELR